jgi:hypothetical protein
MGAGITLLGDECPLPLERPFSPAESRAEGVSPHQLANLRERGLVRCVVRGAYAVAQVADSLETRTTALKLVLARGAIVVDRTAAWLHGVDILPRSAVYVPPPVQIFSRDGSRLRRPGVASGVRSLRDFDVMEIDGLRVTTPLRTALDLGRLLGRFEALAALDGFLRLGVSHAQILTSVERFKGERGVVQLRWIAPLANGRAESPAESALRLHWYDAGLPTPELQWWVHDDDGVPCYRIDLALPELRYGAEYFGEAFHTEADADHDEDRLAWLQSARRWTIDVFVRTDIYYPGDPTGRLLEGLHRARAQIGAWQPQGKYLPTPLKPPGRPPKR